MEWPTLSYRTRCVLTACWMWYTAGLVAHLLWQNLPKYHGDVMVVGEQGLAVLVLLVIGAGLLVQGFRPDASIASGVPQLHQLLGLYAAVIGYTLYLTTIGMV